MANKLTNYSYLTSGDMICSFHSLSVIIVDGEVIIEKVDSSWHDEPRVKKSYKADEKLLDTLAEIVDEYDMRSWIDCPKSEIVMLDGATTNWSFCYENKKYNFSSIQKLPEYAFAAFDKIRDAIDSYTYEENITKSKSAYVKCIRCGTVLKRAYFCTECGSKLDEAEDAEEPQLPIMGMMGLGLNIPK